MLIRPTAFTIGLIIYSFIALFFVYTEFGIDSRIMMNAASFKPYRNTTITIRLTKS